ncbi:MAG: hypothetical protein K0S47_541 [Herbinix sp.]|nr:hypothetical protein [Herbinix sp.]
MEQKRKMDQQRVKQQKADQFKTYGQRIDSRKSDKLRSNKHKSDKRKNDKRKNDKRMKMDQGTVRQERKTIGYRIKIALQLLFLLFLVTVAAGFLYFYLQYGKLIFGMQSDAIALVRESTPETFKAAQTSIVYDADGGIISTLRSEKDVYYLNYEDIPNLVKDAMVVTEDRKFLEHDGVDYLANIRAAMALIKNKGVITQGASTITQQLARNIFLTNEVTYERKIQEIFIAQELEKKYTKHEIIEFYLNNIYFGNGYYGIQAAGKGYFGKSITKLSLSQTVFLCAIPNNPTLYNPVTKMTNTLERRDRILFQLYEDGLIAKGDYEKAIAEKILIGKQKQFKNNYVETYVYYCAIRALMKEKGFIFRNEFENKEDKLNYETAYNELYYSCQKDLFVSGYRIYTSIDQNRQKLLQKSVDQALEKFTKVNEEGVYQMQGAAVCIDNESGKIVAIVGGRDQDLSGYTLNRAYQSFRQPGSAIKPLIVYTPSFERGYNLDSTVVDEPVKGGPKNSGRTYAGEMKLQRAIEISKNTIAWKLFDELTPEVGLSYLLKMNFTKIHPRDYGLAASLGGFTIGVSPVEMAAGFAALEKDGYYTEPTCIIKIMDTRGNEVALDQTEPKVIYKAKAARMMTQALTGVMTNGTGKGLALTNTQSAGKTGTTDQRKDGWFVGYTPYYTTSVWVGYDMPKTVEDLSGSTYPGIIWHNFMDQIHDKTMTDTFN